MEILVFVEEIYQSYSLYSDPTGVLITIGCDNKDIYIILNLYKVSYTTLSLSPRIILPVSYTHLDVYKRQVQ